MITARAAPMWRVAPSLSIVMPVTRSDRGDHPVPQQKDDAGIDRGGVERLHQPVAGGGRGALGCVGELAGLHGGPVHDRGVQRARHRHADFVAAQIVGRLFHDPNAVRE
jgi:hypothetical protein